MSNATFATDQLAAEIKARMNLIEEFQADGREGVRESETTTAFNCPFHSENTASCKVHAEFFKCFGCGAKGDALTYLSLIMPGIKTAKPDARQFVEVLREGCARVGLEFPSSNAVEKPNNTTVPPNSSSFSQVPVQNQPRRNSIPEEPKKVYTYEKLRAMCDFIAVENKEIIPKDCGWNESRNPITNAVEFIEVRFESTVKFRKASEGRLPKPSKRFFQCSAVEGGFICSLDKTKKTPLFNRKQVSESEFVVLVEGFKCMKFLWSLGLCACCAAGGSNNPVSNVDWEPLRGKNVIVWPDNDETGKAWANEVAKILETIKCEVSFVRTSELGLQEKDDVVDYVQYVLKGETEERNLAIIELISNSRKDTIERQIEDEISGKRYAIRHPAFYALSSTNCFLPASVTILCGNEGVSKSFLVVQWIWQMYFDGIDSALLSLESGDVFHDRRVMAQMAGNSGFLNFEWVKNHPEQARGIVSTFKPMCDELRTKKVLQSPPPDTAITPEYIYEWILAMYRLGKKFLIIDPITKLEIGENIAREQRAFVRKIMALALRTGLRILIVTHPIKNSTGPTRGNMSGSAAWQENPDSIFWLTEHENLYRSTPNAVNPMVSDRKPYNRTMKILKSRLGPAATRDVGFYADWNRLIHEEVGFVENMTV